MFCPEGLISKTDGKTNAVKLKSRGRHTRKHFEHVVEGTFKLNRGGFLAMVPEHDPSLKVSNNLSSPSIHAISQP